MAVFGSNIAFNINTINFNLPFQGEHRMEVGAGDTVGGSLPSLTIGTKTYQLPAFSLTYDQDLRVDWDINRFSLRGENLRYMFEGTQVLSGTALAISSSSGGSTAFGFFGFSLSAAELNFAMHTAATADDLAYVTKILAGNDLILASAFNDVIDSGAGRDLIGDQGGSDRFNAGIDNDLVIAGKGDDRVDGSFGNDVLIGGPGNDSLIGGAGRDSIAGGTGSDRVSGGGGADVFLFKSGDGVASIIDFNAEDQILFMGPASGLASLSIVRAGGDVRITFSDVTVLLLNTLRSEVTLADIAIGGDKALNTGTAAFFADWDYVA